MVYKMLHSTKLFQNRGCATPILLALSCTLVSHVIAAPSTRYLSDSQWTSATNGWGPVERNASNGEQNPGDGRPISISGKTYVKGIGAHAFSDVRFPLGGTCTAFTSDIGIDDEVRPHGSVVFQVWADGTKLFDSGPIYSGSAATRVNIDLTGKNELALVINDAGDGIGYDHADWADAQITCNDSATNNTVWTPTANLVASGPLVIDGKQNVTIGGLRITNPTGPCIVIRNKSQNIRIENSDLGPCAGGVIIDFSTSIAVDNVYIHDAGSNGNGVEITFSRDVRITRNKVNTVRTGIYVLSSELIKIDHNSFLNVMGPIPRGQIVQFDKVNGAGNRITCNEGENVLGSSYAEEAINVYNSNGDPVDPILIAGNKIKGGGPSRSGGGIMLGDAGGSFQTVKDNILVNPGQQGVSVASGHDISLINNQIYSKAQPFSNVGLTVWNQYPGACYGITVQGNSVNFRNSAGQLNPTYTTGNCGIVSGWDSNSWNAPLSEAIYDRPISSCRY
jgi:hypothetical protein